MATDLINLFASAFQPPKVQTPTVVTAPVQNNNNPFNNNPFLNYNSSSFSNRYYAQNKKVAGGYFAGYYNGKQNIVGQRLFVEV